jgi:hypothetical protein
VLRTAYAKQGLPVPEKNDATADASAKAEAANGGAGALGTVGLNVGGQKPDQNGGAVQKNNAGAPEKK